MDGTEQFGVYGLPSPVRGIPLLPARGLADTVVNTMAHDTDTTGRRESEGASRDDPQAPSYPLSARKMAAVRRRELTEAILRARAA
jgi:hypothetical protein